MRSPRSPEATAIWSSISKPESVGTENNMRRSELEVRISGPQALGWEGPGFEDRELDNTRQWLRSRGNSIEGGTTEIQLNIIAIFIQP